MRPAILLCLSLAVAANVVSAGGTQTPATPSQPAVIAPPAWSRVLHMPDGRTFVTDGGFAIDAAIAKPSTLPATVLTGKSVETLAGYLAAQYQSEIGFNDLKTGTLKNTFVAPSGVVLNGNYVNFLRRSVPGTRLRFRVKGDFDPIVVVLDGQPIGVLMPVRR